MGPLPFHFTLLALSVVLHWAEVAALQQPCQSRTTSYRGHTGRALAGHSFTSRSGLSRIRCSLLCTHQARCASFNYAKHNATCQLNDATRNDFPGNWQKTDGFTYFESELLGWSDGHGATTEADVWKLVFQGFSGSGSDLRALWTSTTSWSGAFLPAKNWRDDALYGGWMDASLGIKHVKLSVGDSAGVRAELVFDGAGADIRSWLSQERLISSPWEDVKESSYNFFSLDGDTNLERHFFIEHSYADCPFDLGWLVVTDKPHANSCPWESPPPGMTHPVITYSNTTSRVRWSDLMIEGSRHVGRAEYLTIHIQTV